MTWTDLSDDELLVRLAQRCAVPADDSGVRELVADRDELRAQKIIGRILGEDDAGL